MKLNTTPEQTRAIAEMLKPLHVKLFTHESGDPKYNAQRNLSGRTYYVTDETLKWHKSRVLSSGQIGDSWGLLFRITESCALDMHNTKRGKRGTRCVVFDVFGTTVYHPDFESTFSSSKAAEKACSATLFDIVAHYREAIKSKLHYAEQEAAALLTIAQNLEAMHVVNAVLAER